MNLSGVNLFSGPHQDDAKLDLHFNTRTTDYIHEAEKTVEGVTSSVKTTVKANVVQLLNSDRSAGVKLALEVLGQRIEGNFTFEQVVDPVTEARTVKASVENLNTRFGADQAHVELIDGDGLFLFMDSGIAAKANGTLQLSAGSDLSIEGDLSLKINTSGSAVSETFSRGISNTELELPAGPYFRLEGQSVALIIADQEIRGNLFLYSFSGISMLELEIKLEERIKTF